MKVRRFVCGLALFASVEGFCVGGPAKALCWTKLEALVQASPDLDSDPLVVAVVKALNEGKQPFSYWEEIDRRYWFTIAGGRNVSVPIVRRSVDGYVYRGDDGRWVLSIYNINAQPLVEYEVDPNDKTTLRLIFAVKKWVDSEQRRGGKPVSARLRISAIVNQKYYGALLKWGFDAENLKTVFTDISSD